MSAPSDLPIPPRLVWLGEALAPVLARFQSAPTHAGHAPCLMKSPDLAALIDHIQIYLVRLEIEVDLLSEDTFENEHADMRAVNRAAGRFESALDEWSRLLVCAREIWLPGDSGKTSRLLEGALLHIHGDIQRWLAELVELLVDTRQAMRRRGLPETGTVTLELKLVLSAPPQFDELTRHIEKVGPDAALYSRGAVPGKGLGFWGTVGAVALGFGIGNALFGDDDCDV